MKTSRYAQPADRTSVAMLVVGGKRLHTTTDGSAIFVDQHYPIPLIGGKVVGVSRFVEHPIVVVLYPTGVIELIDVEIESQRVSIDAAKDDLRGVTVLAVAVIEQIVALATNQRRVVVVTHSTPVSHPPTWLLTGRDVPTFLRFTPDRKQLLLGHSSGRVNSVDIHMGLLTPIEGSHQELVPAAADPKPTDCVVAAARARDEQVVVVTKNQVQLWTPDGHRMAVVAVALPRGVGEIRDLVFLRRRMFVLCSNAVWEVKRRQRGEKAKLTRADGTVGWCLDGLGILIWRAGKEEPKRIWV